ncbi:hypothetical protein F0562_019232 [Nyssa sinensis]|uniref:Uncharacterized protein n=1 Tax=Nyssa sinensis TaxID=561372 RepID=A0A5J4ZBE9_9ASTE|nr:hypothetical protein F0562_019232 [Nyssa sinensis]
MKLLFHQGKRSRVKAPGRPFALPLSDIFFLLFIRSLFNPPKFYFQLEKSYTEPLGTRMPSNNTVSELIVSTESIFTKFLMREFDLHGFL